MTPLVSWTRYKLGQLKKLGDKNLRYLIKGGISLQACFFGTRYDSSLSEMKLHVDKIFFVVNEKQ